MKTVNDRFVAVTYLIYIIIWETMVLGGFGYIIFWLGHSAWWIIVAIVLSGAAYKPERWQCLVSKCKEEE